MYYGVVSFVSEQYSQKNRFFLQLLFHILAHKSLNYEISCGMMKYKAKWGFYTKNPCKEGCFAK